MQRGSPRSKAQRPGFIYPTILGLHRVRTMCPVLRGELPPIPTTEFAGLRDTLQRRFGHRSVSTPSGPLLVVRVPAPHPDLIRDLEAAADHLPPLDLAGYRGTVLVGDQAHLGVSIDMLRSLLLARSSTETQWLTQTRAALAPWTFTIARLPSDAHRRLRAVIHVDAARVAAMTEPDFDRLAGLLGDLRSQSPGGHPPAFCYLVALEDHVRIEGDRFFQELETRRARIQRRTDETARRKREESYQLARGHIARIEERRAKEQQVGRMDDPVPSHRTTADRYRHRVPVPPEPRARTGIAPTLSRPRDSRPLTRTPALTRESSAPPPASVPRSRDSTVPRPPNLPPKPSSDPLFRAAERHAAQVDHLRDLLKGAGYEVRERLVVDAVPLALAAARPEGYPRRVLVVIYDRVGVDDARRMLRVARGASAELALIITPEAKDGVDRVTLATNLKVIAPEAVEGLRLD